MKEPHETRPGSHYWKAGAKPQTLLDLARAKLALVATCRRCKHRQTLFPYGLASKLGSDFPVDQLAARLRCTECRARGLVTLQNSMRD